MMNAMSAPFFAALIGAFGLAGCIGSSSSGDDGEGGSPEGPDEAEEDTGPAPVPEGDYPVLDPTPAELLTRITQQTGQQTGDPIPVYLEGRMVPLGDQLLIQTGPSELAFVDPAVGIRKRFDVGEALGRSESIMPFEDRDLDTYPVEHDGSIYLTLPTFDDGVTIHGRVIWRTDGTPEGTRVVRDEAGEVLETSVVGTPLNMESTAEGVIFYEKKDTEPGQRGACIHRIDERPDQDVAVADCQSMARDLVHRSGSMDNLGYLDGYAYYVVPIDHLNEQDNPAYRMERISVDQIGDPSASEPVWEFNAEGDIIGGAMGGFQVLAGQVYTRLDDSQWRTLVKPAGHPNYEQVHAPDGYCFDSLRTGPVAPQEIGGRLVFFARETFKSQDPFTGESCLREGDELTPAYYVESTGEVVFNSANVEDFPFEQLNLMGDFNPMLSEQGVRGQTEGLRPLPFRPEESETQWWGITRDAELRILKNEQGNAIATAADPDSALSYGANGYTYLVSQSRDPSVAPDELYRYDPELDYATKLDTGGTINRIETLTAAGNYLFISGYPSSDSDLHTEFAIWRLNDRDL